MIKPVTFAWILTIVILLSFFLHNFLSNTFIGATFFILVFLCFFILIPTTMYIFFRRKKIKGAWTIGFIGLLFAAIVIALGFNKAFFYIFPIYFMLFFLTKRREDGKNKL